MKLRPRELLEHQGRQQRWLARMLEMSDTYVSRLLSGEREWTPELKRLFCAALGVPQEFVDFGDTGAA